MLRTLESLRLVSVSFILLLCAAANVFAQDNQKEPKIGLVLAGGGALGFAHVGVLKVLERERIPVHFVTGTSMGAIVGASYSAGVPLDEMEKLLSETDWDELFDESVPREGIPLRYKAGRNREILGDVKVGFKDSQLALPSGVVQGQNVLPLLQKLYEQTPNPTNFDQLPIPFRAVTADIETGKAVVPDKGDLATIVRASMSVPAFFSPVEYEGKLLVDGGIVNNLPVDEALKRGCDVLIVVELYADYKKRADLEKSSLAVTGQIVSLLLAQNSAIQRSLMREGDILIEPDLKGFSSTDFARGSDIMAKGEEAAQSLVSRLRSLSLKSSEYQEFQIARVKSSAKEDTNAKIAYVKLENDSNIPDSTLLRELDIHKDTKFDRASIETKVKKLYNTGKFTSVSYQLEDVGGDKGVVISAKHKKWLNEYFRFGASIEDNFKGDDSIRLALAFRKTDLNNWGSYLDFEGEIGRSPRLFSEYYQPISPDSDYFVAPNVSIGRTDVVLREGDDKIAAYHRLVGQTGLNFGKSFGMSSEFRFGFSRGFGEISKDIGDDALPEFSFDSADATVVFDHDSLDAPDFPKSGINFNLGYLASLEDLGASADYEQLRGRLNLPYTFGRNTLAFVGDFGVSFSPLPVERSFVLGGWLDVSGYAPSSLIAADYGIARLVYYRQFSEIKSPFLGLSFFAGGSVEYAKTQNDTAGIPDEDINAGSIFLGVDTPVLPLYLGLGVAEGGEQSIYLSLGRLGIRR